MTETPRPPVYPNDPLSNLPWTATHKETLEKMLVSEEEAAAIAAALAEIARLAALEAELQQARALAGRFAYWLVDQGCRDEYYVDRPECTYCGARIIGAGNDCEHKANCDYGLAIPAQAWRSAPDPGGSK